MSEYQPDNLDTEYDSETMCPHTVYGRNVGIPEVCATLYPGQKLHSNHLQEQIGKLYTQFLLEPH
jgi:hypothetical protein